MSYLFFFKNDLLSFNNLHVCSAFRCTVCYIIRHFLKKSNEICEVFLASNQMNYVNECVFDILKLHEIFIEITFKINRIFEKIYTVKYIVEIVIFCSITYIRTSTGLRIV